MDANAGVVSVGWVPNAGVATVRVARSTPVLGATVVPETGLASGADAVELELVTEVPNRPVRWTVLR